MKKPSSPAALRNSPDQVLVLHSEVHVRVTPRGGRDAVIGVRAEDGALLLRVSAPPVDGAANRACLIFVADVFGVRKAQVSLASGAASRDKRFFVLGRTPEERNACLALLPHIGDEQSRWRGDKMNEQTIRCKAVGRMRE